MDLFIDSGNIEEIKKYNDYGIIDGVTTNPSLIAKSGRPREEVIKEIAEIVDGPISAEVISLESKGMIEEAVKLREIHPNIVIKIPLIVEGIKALKWLSDNEIPTNVTLCFSPLQALLAAKNGATFISPFIGRLDDIGQSGVELIREIRLIYDQYGFQTAILAASIRSLSHVRDCALAGADIATCPASILEGMYHHPLTKSGLDQFMKDYQSSQK
jgi:transaldolase